MSDFNTVFFIMGKNQSLVQSNVSTINRAALFGDGLFETMLFINGKIRFSELHWDRLQEGLSTLKINSNQLISISQLESNLADKFGADQPLRVRWSVFRSGLGKYTPVTNEREEIFMVQGHTQPPKIKNEAYISPSIHVPSSPWSHCKTLNALTYVMANQQRSEKKMDEVILLDQKENISEAGSANLFWVKKKTYFTPSLTCNCIAGVSRRKIIEHLKSKNIKIEEGEFSEGDMLQAEQIFTSNVTGIAYLKKIRETEFNTEPIPLIEELFK
ncbi:aminotransferase class IV [Echinicola sp. CAU 1574]|uniref:branched-chain-amino-acid transaminase n=1 Tax=Echinicola arenosa TaxID=2774144 RepID=A0ABR9AEX6_9BACT|nr:aminotransferase class IV [Echinicola arenosa]MBD8487201.1 aminotransferase class IV [Echinicola arenosa]